MRKTWSFLIPILMLFCSCEEYYNPTIDTVEGQLVVEGMVTNDPSLNFVHLTTTSSFYDKGAPKAVTGATVQLSEVNGKMIFQGVENIAGYFYFNMIPISGTNYKLRILLNNDTYESQVVTMPPLPKFTNIYTGEAQKKVYATDGSGVPVASVIAGRNIYADLPVSDSLSYYRFNVRSILEWLYSPPVKDGPPPPIVNGWNSYYKNSEFNLAGPKKFSQTQKIEMYPLLWLAYKPADFYLQSDTLSANGWILIIDQFGTSKESFDYHEKLNNQFAANGSLFDPIQTQVYGNITCITNPSKIVFGYFDMNSYQKYRYYYNMNSPDASIKLRQIFRYPFIPDEGQIPGVPPDWWEI